jgi:hypothetical protein
MTDVDGFLSDLNRLANGSPRLAGSGPVRTVADGVQIDRPVKPPLAVKIVSSDGRGRYTGTPVQILEGSTVEQNPDTEEVVRTVANRVFRSPFDASQVMPLSCLSGATDVEPGTIVLAWPDPSAGYGWVFNARVRPDAPYLGIDRVLCDGRSRVIPDYRLRGGSPVHVFVTVRTWANGVTGGPVPGVRFRASAGERGGPRVMADWEFPTNALGQVSVTAVPYEDLDLNGLRQFFVEVEPIVVSGRPPVRPARCRIQITAPRGVPADLPFDPGLFRRAASFYQHG